MGFRNILKKASAALLALSLMTGLFAVPSSAAGAESAGKAVEQIKAGWNLGNALDSNGDWIKLYTPAAPSDYEKAWGNPVTTPALIEAIKKAGFNAVRVPVTWKEHCDDKGNIDKEWLDRVQTVVDYVMDNGLYCILDVHHDAGSEGWLIASKSSYEKNKGRFEGIWKNVATCFKNYGYKLIFEGFNEMLDSSHTWTQSASQDAYDTINKYNQLFVDTVRSTGGKNADRNLMIQTYSAAVTEKTLSNFVIPKDSAKDHIIAHVHNYDPTDFTFEEGNSTKHLDWGSSTDKWYIDNICSLMKKYSESLGVPFVVGEFGANFRNNEAAVAKYAYYFVTKANEAGIKCFWWDTGSMALIDRNTTKIKHPDVVKALTGKAVFDTSPAEDKPSSSSASNTSNTSSGKLAAPEVSGKLSKGTLTISWKEVKGADGYRVYKYDAKTKKYTKIATVSKTTYTVKGLKKGTHRYKVVAVKKTASGYKNGNYSAEVKVIVKK